MHLLENIIEHANLRHTYGVKYIIYLHGKAGLAYSLVAAQPAANRVTERKLPSQLSSLQAS